MSTIKTALQTAIKSLKNSSSPALDAEVLLSFAINKPKEYLFTYSEQKLTNSQLKKFKSLITQRRKNMPIAYLVGEKEFFGLSFLVDKNTLIPRPATELMVENALNVLNKIQRPITYIDLGTGTGCIPIAILKNLTQKQLKKINCLAIDSSRSALKITKKNIQRHGLTKQITLQCADLLSKLSPQQFRANQLFITANLPYLSSWQYKNLSPEIKKYEPKNALVAGRDGLLYYRKLFITLKTFTKINPRLKTTIICEIESKQFRILKQYISKLFSKILTSPQRDYSGKTRFLTATIN